MDLAWYRAVFRGPDYSQGVTYSAAALSSLRPLGSPPAAVPAVAGLLLLPHARMRTWEGEPTPQPLLPWKPSCVDPCVQAALSGIVAGTYAQARSSPVPTTSRLARVANRARCAVRICCAHVAACRLRCTHARVALRQPGAIGSLTTAMRCWAPVHVFGTLPRAFPLP